tara:strand:- start:1253 stop:1438 length:186 start_codon:yes stop_codon:yes gene_type:complete
MNSGPTKSVLDSEQDGRRLAVSARQIDSEKILAGEREVIIRHGDVLYKLRSTNNGKLILTK